MNDLRVQGTPEQEWIGSNEQAFAIYDKYLVNEGHVLIISNRGNYLKDSDK